MRIFSGFRLHHSFIFTEKINEFNLKIFIICYRCMYISRNTIITAGFPNMIIHVILHTRERVTFTLAASKELLWWHIEKPHFLLRGLTEQKLSNFNPDSTFLELLRTNVCDSHMVVLIHIDSIVCILWHQLPNNIKIRTF